MLQILRRGGIRSAKALSHELGVSQSTVSRAIAGLGRDVMRFGGGPSTGYALARTIGQQGSSIPMYRLNEGGDAEDLGVLHAFHGGFRFEASSENSVLVSDLSNRTTPFNDLPWFLYDLRPQGYVGRAVAREQTSRLGVPPDPRMWSGDDLLRYLIERGDDVPGNIIIGQRMLVTAIGNTIDPIDLIPERVRPRAYLERVRRSRANEVVGSSAGGEQPKFTAIVQHDNGMRRSVIVKFSDDVNTPGGRRWADLLVMEHIAATTLRSHGMHAATTVYGMTGPYMCLEITRFDRTQSGRSGLVSLEALDDGLIGQGPTTTWSDAGTRLSSMNVITHLDAHELKQRYWFGMLIGNTDMHRGNVSFVMQDAFPLPLTPSYDMLPMAYRPTDHGAIVERRLAPVVAPPSDRSILEEMRPVAREFWHHCADSSDISDGMREIASNNTP